MKHIIAYILLIVTPSVFAQNSSSVETLAPVELFHWKKNYIDIDSTYIISDTTFNNDGRLSELILENASFQVRTYGRGMTSGLSVRGSSASHIQVLWHGIPLNSPLNGQTDLNTVSAPLFEQIHIVKGGTSALFGPGAMAGSLLLTNPVRFNQGIRTHTKYSGGSLMNHNIASRVSLSNKRHYLNVGYFYQQDRNKYAWHDKNFVNENGEIFKNDFLVDYAFKSRNHHLEFHVYNSFTDRNLSPALTTESNARLINSDKRYAGIYRYKTSVATWNVQMARIDGKYLYYHNKEQGIAGKGKHTTYHVKTGLHLSVNRHLTLFGEGGLNHISGESKNFDKHLLRELKFLAGIDFKWKSHRITTGIRHSLQSNYRLPLAYFAGWHWKVLPHYHVKLSHSANFRIPTFNDLYWTPGGNPALRPESNTEWELSQLFSKNNTYIRIDLYFKKNFDLIKWRPSDNGYWSPVNIESVTSKGIEFSFTQKIQWTGGHLVIKSGGHYDRVINDNTGKQLIYVPFGGGFIRTQWIHKHWRLNYGFRYQSHYYKDPTHFTIIYGHWLHNLGIQYRYEKFTLGIEVKNIFNQYYELLPARPMPGRTYAWNFKYHINKNRNYEKQNF